MGLTIGLPKAWKDNSISSHVRRQRGAITALLAVYIYSLLHFELNYFTGVNRLTPQTELLHTSKNEVKVIPSLPARSWKSSISTRCFTPRWDWLLPTSRSGVKEITNSHASAFGNFEKVIMMLSIMAWGTFQLNIFNNYSVKHIYFTYSAHYHCHE